MPSQTTDASKDTSEQLAQMRRDVARMEAMVQQLVSASAVENVLINGFTTLSSTLTEQLQPLADLTPKRTQMSSEEGKRLAKVRAELARQTWTGTNTLDPPPFKDAPHDSRHAAY